MLTKNELTQNARKPSALGTSIDGNSSYLTHRKRATPLLNQSKLKIDFNTAILSVDSSPITDMKVLAQRALVQLVPEVLALLSVTLHRTLKMMD